MSVGWRRDRAYLGFECGEDWVEWYAADCRETSSGELEQVGGEWVLEADVLDAVGVMVG